MKLIYIVSIIQFLIGLTAGATAVDKSDWMSGFSEYKLVDLPVIPGTHHSGVRRPASIASYVAWGWMQCQEMKLRDQLENGVRFLDLRVFVDASSERVILSHSFLSNVSFLDALNIVSQFLQDHTSEGVIILVRGDTAFGDLNQAQMDVLSDLILKAGLPLADVSSEVNTLGSIKVKDIAGKILLFAEPLTLNATVPFLWRSTLKYRDIWRNGSSSEAKDVINTYMTTPYSHEEGEFGGVALDGNFIPIQQKYSSPMMNAWFMENLTSTWQSRAKVGIVVIDFATPEYLHALVDINFKKATPLTI
jgi:hypothetical protein